MRILRSVVQALVRTMLDSRDQFGLSGRVGAQLVGHHDTRRDALASQELSHQSQSDFLIPAALQKGIKNIAFGVDGPPKSVFLSLDGHDHFVHMPFVGEATSGSQANVAGKFAAELRSPLRHGLERNLDAPLSSSGTLGWFRCKLFGNRWLA